MATEQLINPNAVRTLAEAITMLPRYSGGMHCWKKLWELLGSDFYETMSTGDAAPIIFRGDLTNPKLIISAHYDTSGNSWTPGACDNASGIVACDLVAKSGLPSKTVVMFLPREEAPYFASDDMGSSYLRKHLKGWEGCFLAVDSIGWINKFGQTGKTTVFGEAPAIKMIPRDILKRLHVGNSNTNRLSDARNFPDCGLLFSDMNVLSVPFHTIYDNVDGVDWELVIAQSQILKEWAIHVENAG
jgi:hypothetical protein